jgi:asparagine synthase (glutamine-hydrolysing)
MHSADGRFVISYNGEIYNHSELRAELEAFGHVPDGGWHGHSDTETLLQGIAVWGLEPTLGKAAGMFAFSLWDRKKRLLHLVRTGLAKSRSTTVGQVVILFSVRN